MELNWTAIDEVIDYLEKHPEEFKMSTFFGGRRDIKGGWCGSTMCIGGTAIFLAGIRDKDGTILSWKEMGRGSEILAAELLGLTEHQATRIFYNFELDQPSKIREHIKHVVETVE